MPFNRQNYPMMMIISSGNAYRSNFILDKTHSTPTHLIFFEYIHPHHLKKIKIPLPQSPKISSSQRERCFPSPNLSTFVSDWNWNINFHFFKRNVNLTTYRRVTQRTFTFSNVAFILEKKITFSSVAFILCSFWPQRPARALFHLCMEIRIIEIIETGPP